MRRLLKYAFVLASGAVIGAYIVLGPLGLGDIAPIPTEREAAVAPVEPAPAATPASPASIDEEVAKRFALETAKVERQFLADRAPAPGNPEASSTASADARAASETALPDSPPPQDTVPAMAATTVSTDAPQDAKPMNEAARPAVPIAETVGADEICQRDRETLEQFRSHPSSDELVRFANELGCKELLPQVVSLMKSLAPAPAAVDVSNTEPSDAQPRNEAVGPAPPVAGADVGSLTSDEACKRDEERLAQLRLSPSGEEAKRFASELGCENLRPQLQSLMESLGSVAHPPPAPASSSLSLRSQGCAGERAALDRLRKEPSAEAAGAFWRDLKCEGLRPQVRRLMESLNVAPEPVGSADARSGARGRDDASSDAPAPNGADPVACRRETAELNRIRATPDLSDAKSFASAMTCDALKPQAARLLESLKE
jgi:hypothetical protein